MYVCIPTLLHRNRENFFQGNFKFCLVKEGYPSGIVDNGIKKANRIPMEELRQPKQNSSITQTFAFVTTCNPRNPDIFQVTRNTTSHLDASPKMKRANANVELINSKRQLPNIKQMLFRANFTSNIATLQNHDDRTLWVT